MPMRSWREGADLANLHQSVVVRDGATCHNDGVKAPPVEPKAHVLLSSRWYHPGSKQALTSNRDRSTDGPARDHRMTRKNTTNRKTAPTHGISPPSVSFSA